MDADTRTLLVLLGLAAVLLVGLGLHEERPKSPPPPVSACWGLVTHDGKSRRVGIPCDGGTR